MTHNIKFVKDGNNGVKKIQHIYEDSNKANIEFSTGGDVAFNTASNSNVLFLKKQRKYWNRN